LYEIDFSFFYTVANDDYVPKSNAVTYANENNTDYIEGVNAVLTNIQKQIELISSIKDSF